MNQVFLPAMAQAFHTLKSLVYRWVLINSACFSIFLTYFLPWFFADEFSEVFCVYCYAHMVQVHVHMFVHAFPFRYVYTLGNMQTCQHVCAVLQIQYTHISCTYGSTCFIRMCGCMCACLCACMCVCVNVCMYACLYACIHVCVCMHTRVPEHICHEHAHSKCNMFSSIRACACIHIYWEIFVTYCSKYCLFIFLILRALETCEIRRILWEIMRNNPEQTLM
jgi:hypothetical protein